MSASSPWARAVSLDPDRLRAWCLVAGSAVLVPVVLDAAAGALPAAGRIFLSGLLVFHLILVPGRPPAGEGHAPSGLEAVFLAGLALPLAEVVRGLTGAGREQLVPAAALLVVAHWVGGLAGRVGRHRPAVLRCLYWPGLVLAAGGLPLAAYAVEEFFGVATLPLHGAPFWPLIRLLDGTP